MGVQIPLLYSQANFLWSLVGGTDIMETTLGIDTSGDLRTVDQLALAVRVAASGTNGPFHPSQYSSEWVFRGVRLTQMTGTGPVIGESLVADAGTAGALASLPPNSAVLVRKRTNRGGRTGRGRMYLPPAFMAEGTVSNTGVIGGAVITTMATRFETMRTTLETDNIDAVLLHEDPLINPTPITAFLPQTLIATQRRRLRP